MDTKSKAQFSKRMLHPRYWLTWILFALWWLVAQLPMKLQFFFGRILGRIMFRFAHRRRLIARKNIELCFPSLSEAEREELVKKNFQATAIGLFETGMAWFGSNRRLMKLFEVKGLENIRQYIDNGQGVLLLALHFTPLEMLGICMNNLIHSTDLTYRPHRNPVYDFVQARRRARQNPSFTALAAGDVRGMVRSLKNGRCISYLPDQDYGASHSVFAPFYGIPTATVVAMARLAAMAKVKVVPMFCVRKDDDSGYEIEAMAPLENYPSGDDIADATRLNAHVEACINRQPEQYLWVHRRFKTRPPGEADVYNIPKRKSRRRR
ncbi:lipid A biosynthesis lauroyl acyltransferase [Aurantivibrio infirmus]